MRVVTEAYIGELELAGAFDIDARVPIDHDVGYAFVREQRLERSQTNHIVDELGNEIALFDRVELDPLLGSDLGHDLADFARELATRQGGGSAYIDARQQFRLDALFGIFDRIIGSRGPWTVGTLLRDRDCR